MKPTSKLLTAILVVSSLSFAYAQTPAERLPTPPPQAAPGSQMMDPGMLEAMQKMQEDMTKIRSTTDQAERQKLIAQHMSTMRDAMVMMMKLGGGPGTGMMPGAGMMRGPSAAPAPGERMPDRMEMMEQRMGMMQMMMEQ